MKTQKTRLARGFNLLTILALFFFISCGNENGGENRLSEQDQNGNPTNPFGQPIGGNPFTGTPPVGGQAGQSLSQLASQIGCMSGSYPDNYGGQYVLTGRRLSQWVTYSGQGYEADFNSTTLDAYQLVPGNSNQGSNSRTYVGISGTNDIIAVTLNSNGFQTTGFSVSVSFCEINYQAPNYGFGQAVTVPLVSDQTPVTAMAFQSSPVLMTQTCSGQGTVDHGILQVQFQGTNTGNQFYTGQGTVLPYTFSNSNCAVSNYWY